MALSPRARSSIGLVVVTIASQVLSVSGATANNVVTAISPTSITVNTATVITLTGTSGNGDLLDFSATCGAAPTTAVAGTGFDEATITITATATGLKLCFRKSGQTDAVAQVGIFLDVIAATPNNKITSISPSSMYANSALAITLFGSASAGDKATFAQDCSTATPNVAVTAGANAATSFTVSSTGTNFRLCYRNDGGSDSVAQDNCFMSVSAVGGVGADPVTWFGDQVRVFSLPPKKLLPLMTATDLTLHGETFAYGGPWQQWFGRLVLASPGGDRWVQVKVRPDILEFNRSRAVKSHFETLEVTLGHGDFDEPSHSTVVPGPDIHIPLNFLGFDVVFWKMARNARAAHTMVGSAHRECMEVAGANVHFYVCSSPAHEFYGWQKDLAVKNAHLDLAIIEVIDGQFLKGTLPELWGMQPLSKETEAFIVKDEESPFASSNELLAPPTSPKQITQQAAEDGVIPEKAPSRDVLVGLALPALPEGVLPDGKGWAGGVNYQDLVASCKVGNETILGCAAKSQENKTVSIV